MSLGINELDKELILSYLDEICASPLFVKSQQQRSILRYIVNETLAGRGDQIKGYSIAVEAIGRKGDFDPNTDSIIRAQIHHLRTKLNAYYTGPGKNDKLQIQIPLNSYHPNFLPGSEPVEQTAPTRQAPELKRPYQSTILVLPFTNKTPEGNYPFLSDGLSEQLSAGLSKFQDINVLNLLGDIELTGQTLLPASRQSVVANSSARFLLEGSYLAVQDSIRVHARLTDVEKSLIIWAEVMDFPIKQNNLLELEDKIVSKILSLIVGDYGKISQYLLSEVTAANSKQPDVFAAVQRYYTYTVQNMSPGHDDARMALEFCVNNVQPCPPLVYSALGELYLSDYKAGFDTVPDAVNKAEGLINKALEMDPSLQNVLLAKANLEFIRRNQLQVEQYLWQAIDANPNHHPAIAAAYGLYARSGHWQEGCAKLRNLFQDNNLALPGWYYTCFFLYSFKQKDYEQALTFAQKNSIKDYHKKNPYYLLLASARLGNKKLVETSLQAIDNFPIDRKSKIERIFYCTSLDDELNEDMLSTLREYGVA